MGATPHSIFVTTWGGQSPYGVGFSLDGQFVYLMGGDQHNIKKYDLDTNLIATITYDGISNPRKMLTLPSGQYIICNYGGASYRLLDVDDSDLGIWNQTALTSCYGLCLFYDQALARNTVLTAGWANQNIRQWELDGTLIKIWTTGNDLGSVADVAIDSVGNVFVCDWTNNHIVWYDNTGAYQGVFTTAVSHPHGITVLKDDTVLVASEGTPYWTAIQAFGPGGVQMGAWATELGQTLDVKVHLFT